MSKKYIVYKHTSPSGHSYVGYTLSPLMVRWKAKINESKGTGWPFEHAINKYGTDSWQHEILFETNSHKLAKKKETEYIKEYGYYNIAEGGDGGNTGRNGELWKRQQHSETMKRIHKENPEKASMAGKINWENSKKNGTYKKRCRNISDRTPRGNEHWMHTGLWIVNHNTYTTLEESAKKEKLNQWTVNEYCNNPDKIFKKDCILGKKGKSRRECGFYREEVKNGNN
jgi:hypothetical protein